MANGQGALVQHARESCLQPTHTPRQVYLRCECGLDEETVLLLVRLRDGLGAGTAVVAQHQNQVKMRTFLALLSHGYYLPYSVSSDSKLLEMSRGLGTGGPAASRHRGQQRARGREKKVWNVHLEAVSSHKVLIKTPF